MIPLLRRLTRRGPPPSLPLHPLSTSSSDLRSKYSFVPPRLLHSQPEPEPRTGKAPKPSYRPPSSLDRTDRSDLPFDYQYSYTESNSKVRPIGRLDRVWTGVCAPDIEGSVTVTQNEELEEKMRVMRERVQGEPLSDAERKAIVERCRKSKTKRQINLGRGGLTHNMINNIHNHWKHSEAVRIKCMGVPTVDMENVCTQLEDKTFGKIINRHDYHKKFINRHDCQLVLYRGRHYKENKLPPIPLMLWKPQEPVYPRLIKTTIEGLSIEETKEMRKKGLSIPALIKLAKNGYYGNLLPIVRDTFLVDEVIRIDCTGLPKCDYKKIGCKLKDLVPCDVTFEKAQIVMWRGKNYNPIGSETDGSESSSDNQRQTDFDSDDETEEPFIRAQKWFNRGVPKWFVRGTVFPFEGLKENIDVHHMRDHEVF